jgi:serine O-acetyltransferase
MSELWTILREDRLVNSSLMERLVVWTYRLRHAGLTRGGPLGRLGAVLLGPWEFFLRTLFSGQISARCTIGRRFRLAHAWGVVIHPSVVIGDGCTIYHQVTLGVNEHRMDKRGPRVGNTVYIGAGAKIIGAIEIGDRAVIGANAAVVSDVPPYHTAVGVPAVCKPKRDRSLEPPAPKREEEGNTV